MHINKQSIQQFKQLYTANKIAELKHCLSQNTYNFIQAFDTNKEVLPFLKWRTQFIDEILIYLWQQKKLGQNTSLTLIAVGGYGRAEMHPYSDVDLLILMAEEPNGQTQEYLSQFIALLWDLGLEIGHSVRTLESCLEEAKKDLTIITNLIESRYLIGSQALFDQLWIEIQPDKIWDSHQFFIAKLKEQQRRYLKHDETAYRLEPNLKDGPGGLRDIQMILWVTQRQYGTLSLRKLYQLDLLNLEEYDSLLAGRDLLWKIRFILHGMANRKEDRLLFDYQRSLANQFCYNSKVKNEAIESFMQEYYRTITELKRLNEMLLSFYQQKIIKSKQQINLVKQIGHWYKLRGNTLSIQDATTFTQYPHTLLEIFLILQTNKQAKRLSATTLRLIRQNLYLIDNDFRQSPPHKKLFISLFRQKNGVTFVLRCMNSYGILAAYLPAFANIVGKMQYDLFHAYTVDAHTLFVIRNLRRLSIQVGCKELPFCAKIFKTIPKPELLYLAALFHDIAKGRGGNHSELGSADAFDFCRSHRMNLHDANLVAWLVRKHLLMSLTAQKKDIEDSETLEIFAREIVEQHRLDYLYLLTVADIRATNMSLWTSWKHYLLKQLYQSTRKLIQEETPLSAETTHIKQQKKNDALQILQQQGLNKQSCEPLWLTFGKDYILSHSVESIVWHTEIILQNKKQRFPLVGLRKTTANSSNVIFIYTPADAQLFSRIVSTFEQLCLNTVEARIISTKDGFALDTFHVLGSDNQLIQNIIDENFIITRIKDNLVQKNFSMPEIRNKPKLQYFIQKPKIDFKIDKKHQWTMLEITATDMPGLLSKIGHVFYQEKIRVHNAKIATLGDQAQDIFYITNQSNKLIMGQQQQWLREKINSAIYLTSVIL